ncbi:hypothetical protein FQN54_000942 [Arachnomyces sp. PD_36]|nr:hypothetical protein FQN54_000942 [Arachnomyces sp. PD_36]
MPRPPAKRGRGRPAQKGPSKPAGRVAKPTRENIRRDSANNTHSNSDDSDGLVVSSSRSRSRPRRDVFMSGGLGKGDVKDAHKRTPKRNEPPSPSANRSRADSTVASSQHQRAKSQTTPTANNAPADSSRLATATGNRPRGFSSTLSLAGKRPDMNAKVPGTPGFESSMLSNFKRRPRQPSILQMMQDGEDGSSDFDDDDFLGKFSPEDESTPLNRTRGKSIVPNTQSSPSQLPSSADSRKRKHSEIQVPRTQSEAVEDSSEGSPAPSDDEIEMSEDDSLPLPPRSETPATPEIFSQTLAPPMSSSPVSSPKQTMVENDADSHAAKRSRTQKVSKKTKPSTTVSTAALQENLLPKRRQRRQQPRRFDKATDFDMPDDDSVDEQDGRPEGAASDEDELSYLPTRRPRKKALAESTNIANGKGKAKKGDKGSKTRKNGKGNPSNGISTNKLGSVAPQIATSESSAAKTSQESQPRERATYSSRTRRAVAEGNKENQPSAISSLSSSPTASDGDTFNANAGLPPVTNPTTSSFLSKELELQAKKFAEIDMWSMDFEDVTASAVQSSPYR